MVGLQKIAEPLFNYLATSAIKKRTFKRIDTEILQIDNLK